MGGGSRILQGTIIERPEGIIIGDRTYVNEKCYLDGRGGLTIGNDCTIAIYSKLLTAGHNIDDDEFKYQTQSITIEDNAAIFAGCILTPGVIVKKGTVMMAGSVVKRGVYGPLEVYGGNPAKFIRGRKTEATYRADSWHPVLR